MGLPSISHWVDCIANPDGRFCTLAEFEAERDGHGIRFRAGNNAAVFTIAQHGRRLMLKCYIKDGAYREEIYGFAASTDDSLLAPARLLKGEAWVHDDIGEGAFHDVVVAEWVDGATLETEIKRAAQEFGAARFAKLAKVFDTMAAELLSREWAHGDLKPENIIVTPTDRMTLIDYDAMFVPSLASNAAFELGTLPYQHPSRTELHFDRHLDDYPAALISVSLHALELQPELYEKYHRGDNIIMYPEQIVAGQSAAYDEVLGLFAAAGEFTLYKLACGLRSPFHRIDGLRELMSKIAEPQKYRQQANPPELFCSHGCWGYRSEDGRTVIESVFDEATEFSEGLATVCIENKWFVIDTDGRMAIDTSEYETVKPFGGGLAAFKKDNLWGYIDKTGRVVIAPNYETAGTMHEGLAAVCLAGKYGYVDTAGNIVIEPRYDRAMGFRDGRAMVFLGNEIAHIDLFGNTL